MEQALVEYLANAFWQIPLLALGAWLLLRALRAGPRMQYWVWLTVLGLAVVLPMRGIILHESSESLAPKAVERIEAQPATIENFYGTRIDNHVSAMWTRMMELPTGVKRIRLGATATRWIARAYFLTLGFGLLHFLFSWRRAQQLVATSRDAAVSDHVVQALKKYCAKFQVTPPALRESSNVLGPIIVGAAKPVLLLPAVFAHHSEDEIKAVLCHELGHVRRHDYLVNLVSQLVALPVAWHPVTYVIKRRISRTREIICDAMAAQEMQSGVSYARCLVALAQEMLGGKTTPDRSPALSLFDNNVLEERVMWLTNVTEIMSARERVARLASGIIASACTILVATMFHVTPTLANTQPPLPSAAIQSDAGDARTVAASPTPEVAPAAKPAPAAKAAPAAKPAPAAKADPAAKPTPAAKPSPNVSTDTEGIVIVPGDLRELTPEQHAQIQKDLREANEQIREATRKLNSAEFKEQIEDAIKASQVARNVDMAKIQKEVDEATRQINSAEFKRQMAEINGPEFQQKMKEIQEKLNNGELQRQIQSQLDAAARSIKEQQERLNNPAPK